MSYVATHPEASIELELASRNAVWGDRLRSGIWPKPIAFWAVVFYIGIFIIRPWEKLFPELGPLRFERLSVMAVIAVVFLHRGFFVRLNLQNVTMIGLFLAVYASGKRGIDPFVSGEEITEFFGFTLIFFLIQKAVRSPYQALFIIASYLMLTTAYIGKSLWEFTFHGAAMYMMGVRRLAGIDFTYGHPNTVGTTLLCSLPFAIYFYRIREDFCRTWPKMYRKLFRWVVMAHIVMAVTGILLTKSRSTAIALVFFVLIVVLRQKGMARKMKWGILSLIVLLVGFAFLPPEMQNRIRSIWDSRVEVEAGMKGANAAKNGRYEGLLAGLAIYEQFPSTGVGIGNFADYRFSNVDGEKLNAHNLPGELLGELGTLGTLAFVAFFLAHFLTVWKLSKQGEKYEQITGNTVYSRLSVCLYDAMLIMMFSGLSGHTLQQYQRYFFASFAVTALYFVKQEVRDAQARLDSLEPFAEGVPA